MKKLFLILLLIYASIASADVTIKENSDGAELVTYFSKGMSAHYVDGQITNVTDMNTGTITVMNPMSKTYFQATLAQMKNLADSLNEKMKVIQSNPQYQAMLKQHAESVKVTKQGIAQLAGYTCTKYTISVKMPPTKAEICLSKDLANLVSKEISSKQLEKIMDSLDSGDGGMDMLSSKISELEEKNGYLMSENIDMMGTGISTIVTNVSKKSIDKSVFKIPSDYTRKPMPQVFGE